MGVHDFGAKSAATPILRRFVLRGNPSGEIAGVGAQSAQSIMCTKTGSGRVRSLGFQEGRWISQWQ